MLFTSGWILLLFPLAAAAGRDCHVEQNGIRFVLNKSVPSCAEYNWRVNETVIANEKQSDTLHVQTWGNDSISFYSCEENVIYKSECSGNTIDCSYPCPVESKFATTSERSSSKLVAVIGGSIAVVIVLCTAVLILCTSERLRTYFQAKTAAWCRCYYSAAPQTV